MTGFPIGPVRYQYRGKAFMLSTGRVARHRGRAGHIVAQGRRDCRRLNGVAAGVEIAGEAGSGEGRVDAR